MTDNRAHEEMDNREESRSGQSKKDVHPYDLMITCMDVRPMSVHQCAHGREHQEVQISTSQSPTHPCAHGSNWRQNQQQREKERKRKAEP
jgi:hypothetical protein